MCVDEKRNVRRDFRWKPEGTKSLERTKHWWDILLISKKRIEGHGVDLSGSSWGKIKDSCE
jgi:hypothetical protein